MPDLESRLDTLAGPAEGFPPDLAAALRSTRRRRRALIGGLSAAGAIALAAAISVLITAGSRPHFSAPGPLARQPAPAGPFTLVSLTRQNRDADLENLSLPATESGTADPFRTGPAGAHLLGYR